MKNDDTIFFRYRQYISNQSAINDNSWQLFEQILAIKQIPKGTYTLEEGKICRFVDYLYDGCFRMVHNREGKEVTTALYTEGVCITNMKSLSSLTPSEVYLEALEDSVVVRVYKDDLVELYNKSEEMQRVGRAILELMVIEENNWKEMYTLYGPEERYRFLLRKAPQFVQRISLMHIASFLGIRRETLSRIRARLKNEVMQ